MQNGLTKGLLTTDWLVYIICFKNNLSVIDLAVEVYWQTSQHIWYCYILDKVLKSFELFKSLKKSKHIKRYLSENHNLDIFCTPF